MKLSENQIESVKALAGPERYEHFVKVVVDREEVWGLYHDGWALASTRDGQKAFPVWPAEEYAALCVGAEWAGYEPTSFSLAEFMDELLPGLKRDSISVDVFHTPSDKGVTPTIDQLLEDLNQELENY